MKPTNKYIGRRYVPKQCGNWSKNIAYESLSVVLYQGNSYTSKQDVPIGIDIENSIYWVQSANYNAQVAIYEQNVRDYHQYVIDQIGLVNESFNDFKEEQETTFNEFKSEIDDKFLYNETVKKYDVVSLGIATINEQKTYDIDNSKLMTFIDSNRNAELYFPSGTFNLAEQVTFLYGASLNLHKNAEIIAVNEMEVMFSFSNVNLTAGLNLNNSVRHQRVIGGLINGGNKAKVCIKVQGYQDFIIKDTRIQNFINKGIYSIEPSAELKIENIYLFNETSTLVGTDNVSDNIALDIQSTDNYISNCTIVDCSIGIAIGQGGNYVDKCHYWVNDSVRVPYSVAFWTQTTGYARWLHCVSDTAQIGFKCGATTMWLENCEVVNGAFMSDYFTDKTATCIYIEDTSSNYILNVIGCSFTNWSEGALTVNCLNFDGSTNLLKRTRIQGNTFWGDIKNKPTEDYEFYSTAFTPILHGATTNGVLEYTTQIGRCYRVGKMAHITINIRATVDDTIGGNLKLSGLPYYSASNLKSALSVGYISNFPEQVNNPCIESRTKEITFYEVHEDAQCVPVWSNDLRGKTIEIWLSGSYMIE